MYPCPFMFFLPLFVTDIPPTNRQNWLCFKTVFKIWPCSFPPQKRGLRTACMGNWSFQKQSIWKCAYWSITFDFGLHDGVDVRTVGRSDGRSYDDVITKISRMDGLPYFLSNGARRARSSAITTITTTNFTQVGSMTSLTISSSQGVIPFSGMTLISPKVRRRRQVLKVYLPSDCFTVVKEANHKSPFNATGGLYEL